MHISTASGTKHFKNEIKSASLITLYAHVPEGKLKLGSIDELFPRHRLSQRNI